MGGAPAWVLGQGANNTAP